MSLKDDDSILAMFIILLLVIVSVPTRRSSFTDWSFYLGSLLVTGLTLFGLYTLIGMLL